MKTIFYKIAKFTLDEKTFIKFNSPLYGDAYLRFDGKYHYPTMEEFVRIISLFQKSNNNIFSFVFKENPNLKFKFEPKIIYKGTKVVLTSALVMSILTGCGISNLDSTLYGSHNTVQVNTDFLDEYNLEDYIVSDESYDTDNNYQREFDLLFEGDTSLDLNNTAFFDKIFGTSCVSLDNVYATIDSNKNIDDEYKIFIKNYMKDLVNYYPDLELRIFNYNFKTLKISYKDGQDINFDTNSSTSAYYNYDNNEIILNKDIDYENNLYDLVILRHELGHVGNHFSIESNDYKFNYSFKSSYSGKYIGEALDVIFTTAPYMESYKENNLDNLGYPLITNELRIILDSIDYSPEDSISNNVYYLEKQMNEKMEDVCDAHYIVELIDFQEYEALYDDIKVDHDEYNNLFSYLSDIYLKQYASSDMSYDDLMNLKNDFISKLSVGVENSERIYSSVIDDEFEKYVLENGISNNLTK